MDVGSVIYHKAYCSRCSWEMVLTKKLDKMYCDNPECPQYATLFVVPIVALDKSPDEASEDDFWAGHEPKWFLDAQEKKREAERQAKDRAILEKVAAEAEARRQAEPEPGPILHRVPCKVCGKRHSSLRSIRGHYRSKARDHWYIACCHCRTRTPIRPTREEASETWNRIMGNGAGGATLMQVFENEPEGSHAEM